MVSKSVLIVDDDERILMTIKDILEARSYTVIVARDGATALSLFDAAPVDLVITDINMPEMEGIELLRHLTRRQKAVPILVMSGDPVGERFLKAARLLGAVDAIFKPFSIAELLHKVENALSSAELPPSEEGAG